MAGEKEQPTALESKGTKKEVVVAIAVDMSNFSDEAFRYYLQYLHKPNHKVVLVHAAEVHSAKLLHGIHIEDAEVRDEMWTEATKEREKQIHDLHLHLEQLVTESGKEVPHEILITQYHHGHLGEAIVNQATEIGATMIITGTRGLGMIRRTILGSVSDYVLRHARCPVLICHYDHDKYHHHHEPTKVA